MKRQKIRSLGLSIGKLPVGTKNCITDVPGVQVGHETLYYPLEEEGYACTGVTAILPHKNNIFRNKVAAASYVLNGFGKTTGLVQINELGRLESPIMLTNTFGVPAVTQGTLEYLLEMNPEIGDTTGTVNAVVGECNDSYLNTIRSFPIKPEHARNAILHASTKQVEEGAIGAGKGMVCFEYKGGIGCSSRVIKEVGVNEQYVVGALVLSNFGKQEELLQHKLIKKQLDPAEREDHTASDGSIMMILATNAPLHERQLKRLAKRASVGLGRSGSNIANGSGDIVIAFSTAQTFPHHVTAMTETMRQLREDQPIMNQLFAGAAEAVEEAILNSLTVAKTTKGREGREVRAFPYELLNNRDS